MAEESPRFGITIYTGLAPSRVAEREAAFARLNTLGGLMPDPPRPARVAELLVNHLLTYSDAQVVAMLMEAAAATATE